MADRDLRIRMLLEAADRVSRPLRDIAGGNTRAAQTMRTTRDRLKDIDRAQRDIAGFRELKAGTRAAELAMKAAQARASQLGRELAQTATPSRKLTREFNQARSAAEQLGREHQEQSRRLSQVRDRLQAAGVSTRDLARHERELRTEASRTNAELTEQARRLQITADRQRRFSAARDQFGRGQQLAGSMAIGGTAAVAAGAAIARPLAGVVAEAQRFESVMTDIAQKGDLTRAQARALGQDLLVAARNANQLPEAMQSGMDALMGLGASVPDAAAMIPSIGRASTAYKAEVGDMAAATYAVHDNLKVTARETGRVIDVMAQTGKRGAFEMKDMAGAFPSLTAAYQGLGQRGVGAVADLAAGLQIARKGAGDSATAGTNLANVLQKIASPATNKAFAKMGVDLPAALKKAYREGKTPLEAITQLTNETLKGDLSRLGYLFEDAQVQAGLRPLIQNFEEFKRIRAEAMAVSGTTDSDFAERMRDSAEQTKALQVKTQALSATLGATLLPTVNAVMGKISGIADRFAQFAQRHPAVAKALLLTAGAIAVILTVLGVLGIAIGAIVGPLYLFGAAATMVNIGLMPLIGTVLLVVAAVAILAYIAYKIYENWGAIGTFFAGLWSGVKATTSGVVDWFAALPSRFAGFGRAMISGLIGGFLGMLGNLKSTIVDVAGRAAGWFKAKLGIRSPSRVFAGFGGFMMQGLSNGIAGGADGPVRRVDGLSRRLTRALAVGVATPMVATAAVGAGGPGGGPGGSRTPAAPAPVVIQIYGAAGQSPEALAKAVVEELDRRERASAASARSTLADDLGDW